MTDASARERLPRPLLEYPCGPPPAAGSTVEILPGIRWIRMPMPGALNHINLWLIREAEGFSLVDTGMRTDESAQAWQELLGSKPEGISLTRVLITHMHPDHVGMAGWLTRKFGCRMWMTRQEYLYCRVLVADTGREAPQDAMSFYRRAGWTPEALDTYRARFGNFGKRIHPLPESFRRIQEDDEFVAGGHSWRVIIGTGHSPEHACFFCAELKVLISGDQVLPRISSNVSVHPTEPDSNPMQDWLQSLAKIRRQVSDDVLVLPSHNEPFRGLHARLEHLKEAQLRTIDRLRKRLIEPRRVIDVFGTLFGRDIAQADGMLLNLATGEAQACLNYLMHRDELRYWLDSDGVAWYQSKTRAQKPNSASCGDNLRS